MTAFSVLTGLSEREWLQTKNRFVTSTDAPVILGWSSWKGRAQLWAEKLGLQNPAAITSSMQQGIKLESKILKRIPAEFPHLPPLVPAKDFYLSNRYPNFACSLDAWNQEHKIICEIKTATRPDYWMQSGKIELPFQYHIQVQFQLLVTGFEKAVVIVFFHSTKTMHQFDIRPNDKLQNKIITECSEFWDCLKSRTPPFPDHLSHPHQEMQALFRYYSTNPKQGSIEIQDSDLDKLAGIYPNVRSIFDDLKIIGHLKGFARATTDQFEIEVMPHPDLEERLQVRVKRKE